MFFYKMATEVAIKQLNYNQKANYRSALYEKLVKLNKE